jgi:hypothetical protein
MAADLLGVALMSTTGRRFELLLRPDASGPRAIGHLGRLAVTPGRQRLLVGPLGVPNPKWFEDDYGRTRYLQTHFVWSIPFRALSTAVDPP